jgi:acetylglutamate kinase
MTHDPPGLVLKVGGRELQPGPSLHRLVAGISRLVGERRRVLLVHGGGSEVTERTEALGRPTERVGGQRITDAATREIVVEVLAGRINVRLVAALRAVGLPAVGLTGVDDGILQVVPAGAPPGSLGFVGEPSTVRIDHLEQLLGAGKLPVLAPLGVGSDGEVYNVNADRAAAALAGAFGADLLLLTNVAGVRDPGGQVIHRLEPARLRSLLADGTAHGGMIPKLEGAATALAGGARSVWIGDLDGLDGFEAHRAGTRVVAGPVLDPLLPPGGSPR